MPHELPQTETDPVSPDVPLRRALESSERFRRDTLLGGIFHLGKASFRELAPTDAVHITIDGTHVSAHVDDISPVKAGPDGRTRYSWPRIVAHNLFGIASDVVRRLHGRHGQQRCSLDCEVVWVDDDTVEVVCEESQCPTNSSDETPPKPAVGREPLTLKKHC